MQRVKDKVREAKEMGDKLALKPANLDRASALERKKREDYVAQKAKTGIPLSQVNAKKLRDKEEKKRFQVNKALLKKNQGR